MAYKRSADQNRLSRRIQAHKRKTAKSQDTAGKDSGAGQVTASLQMQPESSLLPGSDEEAA